MYSSDLEDIVRPFKKSGVNRNELLLLQAILTSDPAIKGIRPAASDLLLEFRNEVQELLVGVMKRTRKFSPINVHAQFGNYLLLTPTIIAIADRISTVLRQRFPLSLVQSDLPFLGILQTLAHPDTTDYLRFPQLSRNIFAIEKQESSSNERNTNTPVSYNPWHSVASAFSNIQMPGSLPYNSQPPNFSIVSALSPNSSCSSIYSPTNNLFPAQPLPPLPEPSSTHIFITTTSTALAPPLTITTPTPLSTALCPPQFMPFHTPPQSGRVL